MPKISYVGNGTTTEFAFDFPFYENTNIFVTKNNATATGYTIIGTSAGQNANIPYTGGKVVFDVAPSIIDTITIKRKLPLNRVVDYQPTAKIDPTTLNQDMNYNIEVLKDMAEDLQEFCDKYEEIVDKPSTEELLEKIENIDEEIDDFYDDIENGRVMSKDDFYSYATNCVIEAPQNINLVLNDGNLTLKAGSKIYIPNGATFNTYTVQSDISTSPTGDSGTYGWFLIMRPDKTISRTATTNYVYSGDNAPSGFQYMYWYDTANNLVKFTTDFGVTWESGYSLPIALISGLSGVQSVNQIFNGVGYIGSTVFTLPGITTLIPSGRNNNGSLKNIKHTTSTVLTYTRNLTETAVPLWLKDDDTLLFSSGISYDTTTNQSSGYVQIGSADLASGIISNLTVKQPLRIADLGDLNS